MLNNFIVHGLVVGMGMYFMASTLITVNHVVFRDHNRLPDIFHHHSSHAVSSTGSWIHRYIRACGISSLCLRAYR